MADIPGPPEPEDETAIWLSDYQAAHRLLNALDVAYADGEYVLNLCERIRRLVKQFETRAADAS